MNLKQLKKLVTKTIREERSRNGRSSEVQRRREQKLIKEAVRNLELLFEDAEVSTDSTIASMSQDELAAQIEEYCSSPSSDALTNLVGFLNAAAMSNTENITKVLDNGGDSDQSWSWKAGGDSAKVSELYPTQGTIDFGKSLGYVLSKDFANGIQWEIANPNSTFGDGREMALATTLIGDTRMILDGHHRWSALHLKKGKDSDVAVATLTIPNAKNALDGLMKSQLGIAHAAAQKHPDKFKQQGLPFAAGDDSGSEGKTSVSTENRWRKGNLLREGGEGESSQSGSSGGGTTSYGEILKEQGSIDILAYHNQSLGMTNHDSKEILGNHGWWKALKSASNGDQAAAFGWIKGYTAIPDEAWQQCLSEIDGFPDDTAAIPNPSEAIKACWAAMGQAFANNWSNPNRSPNPDLKREVMPQYAGSKDSYEMDLEQDVIGTNQSNPANYNAPFKESKNIDLKRWSKLAGILKS